MEVEHSNGVADGVPAPNLQLSQLEKLQDIIQAEARLTDLLERVEPWLISSSSSSSPSQSQQRLERVRPVPQHWDEVESVLAVARLWAARTSAPAGWNPMAPVVGFSTPSPLPHQLRRGALATLQLDRARQAERDKKKRQRDALLQKQQEEEKEAATRKRQQEAADAASQAHPMEGEDEEEGEGAVMDPKRREVVKHEHEIDRAPALSQTIRPRGTAVALKPQDVSMNLSDSDDDDDDDDD